MRCYLLAAAVLLAFDPGLRAQPKPGPVQPLPIPTTDPKMPQTGGTLPATLGRGTTSGFVRPASTTGQSGLPIDQRQLQVKNVEGTWKLFSGPICLEDFGAAEHDAKQAMTSLRFLRVTERIDFGAAGRGLSVYLANGQPPRGNLVGVRSVSVQPQQMSVFAHGKDYWLIDKQRRYVAFDKEEDAKKALDEIRKHGFDEVFLIGKPKTVMLLFVKNR
jgi:hypothetical protein